MTFRKTLIGAVLVFLAGAGTAAFAQDPRHDDHGPGNGNGNGNGNGGRGSQPAGPGRAFPEVNPGRGGPGRGGPGGPGARPAYHGRGGFDFDQRYNHNRYYPSRGFVGDLPYGSVSIGFGGGNYFFHSGVWYRPWNGRYVVVDAPFGIFVPSLPVDYVPLYFAGSPYYYADGTYYTAVPGQGYEVVAPPPGADVAQPAPQEVSPPAPDPIYYPRNGQLADQTEADRRDCNSWATSQPRAMADAQVFKRAVDACMDGRGYTVR